MAVAANKKVKENEGGKHRAKPENFQRNRGVGYAGPGGPSYFISFATGSLEGPMKEGL